MRSARARRSWRCRAGGPTPSARRAPPRGARPPPPPPATTGLWGAPTVVQNAETLAHVAWIVSHSPEAFATVGSDASRGTKLVTIMGRVMEPGLVEVPLGTSLLDLVSMAGGGAGTTKAVFV